MDACFGLTRRKSGEDVELGQRGMACGRPVELVLTGAAALGVITKSDRSEMKRARKAPILHCHRATSRGLPLLVTESRLYILALSLAFLRNSATILETIMSEIHIGPPTTFKSHPARPVIHALPPNHNVLLSPLSINSPPPTPTIIPLSLPPIHYP